MQKNILIVGGTGHIGTVLHRILKDRNPSFRLFIGGRNKEVAKLTNHLYIDVTDTTTFDVVADNSIDLIILSTIDTDNNILRYCIDKSVDYLDVTKPTPDIENTLKSIENKTVNSRIVFASGWMGGIISGLITSTDYNFTEIDQIEIMIYYSLNDKAGKSAADFMAEDVCRPFYIYKNNKAIKVKHFRNSQNHNFSFGLGRYQVYNFNIPDLRILNQSEKVPSVSAKITYNSKTVSYLLKMAQTLRIFDILSLNTRKKMFQSKGTGDKTAFDIIVTDYAKKQRKVSLLCSLGQAELTAFSIALHAYKLLSVDNGVYFGHQLYKGDELYKLLNENQSIEIEKI